MEPSPIINGPIEYRALRHAKHNAFFVWSAVINLHMRTLLTETPIIYLFQYPWRERYKKALEQSANTKPEISSRLTDRIMSSRTPRRVLVVECPFPKPGNLIETNNLRVVPLVLDELSRTFEMIVLYEIVQETYNKKRSIIEQGFHLTWESNRKLVINLSDFHSMSYFSGA